MVIYESEPSNNIVIVDKEKYCQMKELAGLNKERIEQMAKDKYLEELNNRKLEVVVRVKDMVDVVREKTMVSFVDWNWKDYPNAFTRELAVKMARYIILEIDKNMEEYTSKFEKYAHEYYMRQFNPIVKRARLFFYTILVLLFLLLSSWIALAFCIN